MNVCARFQFLVLRYIRFVLFLALAFCLTPEANAFDFSGYVKVPQAGGAPKWVKTARITRVGGVPTVWTVGGARATASINPATVRTICRVRQACVALFGVVATGAAIGFYQWQQGQEPGMNDELGYEACLTKFETVDGRSQSTINVPCASGDINSYSIRFVGHRWTHGAQNSYGESVTLSSAKIRSNKDDYTFPDYWSDPVTRVTGDSTSTRFQNSYGVQTAQQYLDDPDANPVTEEQWWDAIEQTQGQVVVTDTALDGLDVAGGLQIATSTLTAADYLTDTQVADLGLEDVDTGTDLDPEPVPDPAATAVCGVFPLPPCDVNVTNWPEAPEPEYLLGDDEGVEEEEIDIGLIDFGSAWLPKQCPAPQQIPFPNGSFEVSFQPVCDFNRDVLSKLVRISSLLAALAIVFSAATRSS